MVKDIVYHQLFCKLKFLLKLRNINLHYLILTSKILGTKVRRIYGGNFMLDWTITGLVKLSHADLVDDKTLSLVRLTVNSLIMTVD